MPLQSLTPKPRILAVDDDPDVLRLIELTLERAGYEVAVAQDGPSALAYVDAEHPDVMLLDLWMPVMDGFGVLDELRRRDRSPRVVKELRRRVWPKLSSLPKMILSKTRC